jgi:hypothetical protein
MRRFPVDDDVLKEVADDGTFGFYHSAHDPPVKMTESEPYALPPTKGKDRKKYGPGPRELIQYVCPDCSPDFFTERTVRRAR